jgi:hypothetical protein
MPSSCSSDTFSDFDNSDDEDTLDLPSFSHIFQTDVDLIEYAQGWAIEARYALTIARSTCNDEGGKTRVYLWCDRGGKSKAR